jgi:hypothetical protein
MKMKKMVCILLCVVVMAGCASKGTFEQLQDVYAPEETPEPRKISLTLPEEAAAHTLTGNNGKLYFCDGYEIAVETLAGGDLDRTLKILTGCNREDLTLLETGSSEKRWETVWTAAGEGSQQVGRLLVVDDGSYHYCVSVMADALDAGALQESWEALFSSVVLSQ